jgi:sugar lactone lactonase YvrE
MSSDFPVVVGQDGAFYYPATSGPEKRVQLLRWTANGERSVLATLPAANESGPLQWINGLAAGPDGAIYYTENQAVRRVSALGEISTVAAKVSVSGCIAVPGNEPDAGVFLRGLAVTPDGTVYVAAAGCGAVLRINRGAVTPVHRTTSPWSPTAVAVAGRDVFVLEYLHTATEDRQAWLPRVRQLRADGASTILATISRR